ncbi:hypothetical protein K432DRAFT_447669 [Lepidopterella palustris CBS 459.81]|uniref:Fucose-specific lectin n=1 Tax=Lepidopterella palustris CBS 459.81 TaxID=1314670 RepID=A0A8E2DY48_9PEZI|nr:hypothetical protein K432DRAFT_447669 [Lepidopterella palustris CBS 459.81]
MGKHRCSDLEGLQVVHEPHSTLEVNVHDQDTRKEAVNQTQETFDALHYPENFATTSSPSPTRLLFGVRRKVFFISIAVTLIVVAAVAGGVAGALTKKSNATTPPTSSPSPYATAPSATAPSPSSTTYPMSPNSKLAAIAWNDTNGVTFQRLYYQNTNNAISESAWNSSGQAWYVNGNVITNAKNGTAIAATVTGPPDWPFQITVYIMNEAGTITERNFNSDNTWSDGPLTSENIRASQNSSLTAVYHRHTDCPLCPNTQLLIYQNETMEWNLGNETASGWVWRKLPANPIAGSPSALSLYSQPSNFTAQLRFWYLFPNPSGNDNVVCGLDWTVPAEDAEAAANGNWANRESNCLSKAVVPSTASIASFTYGTAKNGLNIFMDILNSNSNKGVTNQPWLGSNGGFWADAQTPFVMSSVDANSPLAANAEAHVFGFVDGKVNEFVLAIDGVTWNLVGGVAT